MDLSDKVELRWLSAILSDARDVAPDVDLLVVGAMARDLLLHYGHGVPITRATTDIDFGLAVADWGEFQQLRDSIQNSENFTLGRPGNHRLVHRGGIPLDLIPFGGVERDDGTIIMCSYQISMTICTIMVFFMTATADVACLPHMYELAL